MRHSRLFPTNATSQLGPQFAVLRLRSWPDMRHVADELIPDVVRICALLSFRPTGAPLIHRLLNIPRERAQHVVDMLHLHGHLSDGTPVLSSEEKDRPLATEPETEAPSTMEATSSMTGFLDRLWRKLLSVGAL